MSSNIWPVLYYSLLLYLRECFENIFLFLLENLRDKFFRYGISQTQANVNTAKTPGLVLDSVTTLFCETGPYLKV